MESRAKERRTKDTIVGSLAYKMKEAHPLMPLAVVRVHPTPLFLPWKTKNVRADARIHGACGTCEAHTDSVVAPAVEVARRLGTRKRHKNTLLSLFLLIFPACRTTPPDPHPTYTHNSQLTGDKEGGVGGVGGRRGKDERG